MSGKIGFFDDAFEQGGQIVKGVAKNIANAPKAAAQTAASQVAPGLTPTPTPPPQEDVEQIQKQNSQNSKTAPSDDKKPQINPEDVAKKDAEKKVELEKVRQELHANYYQGLVNRPKKEERAGEKVEREEKEEEREKFVAQEEKKKKELPVTVRQGTGEKLPRISG